MRIEEQRKALKILGWISLFYGCFCITTGRAFMKTTPIDNEIQARIIGLILIGFGCYSLCLARNK
jgi:threonine/homoserine/homoserine lactone efflux protein